jgi:hypothetical protein
MRRPANPFVTTLIGGVVFLLPMVVVLLVVGQGLALTTRVAQPMIASLPYSSVGSVALVAPERIEPLEVDPVALTRSLQRLGQGTADVLNPGVAPRPGPAAQAR